MSRKQVDFIVFVQGGCVQTILRRTGSKSSVRVIDVDNFQVGTDSDLHHDTPGDGEFRDLYAATQKLIRR